ncbi:MAG: FtsX-like permease family protein, partial [Gemmatimonadaceae bacterium]
QSRCRNDSGVIGRTVELGGFSYRIIGVMRPRTVLPFVAAAFTGSQASGGAMHRVDFWIPFRLDPNARAQNAHFLQAVARMKPGVTPQTVHADLQRVVNRFPDEFPSAYSATFIKEYQFGIAATSLRRDVLGSTERVLWLILGAVGLVFAIAAINVANLFLVRAEVRRRETAVRSALGAGRGQLAMHYMSESVLLALLATSLGLLIAHVAVRTLIGLAPEGMPRLDEVHIGLRSVGIAVALGTACGVAFGLFPLAGDSNSAAALRDGARGATVSRGRRRVRGAMVVGQVTLALVLLAGAGVMVRSVLQLYAVRPGFDAARVLAIDLPLSRARYRTYDDVALFHRTLHDRVSALPGVRYAALGTDLPLDGMGGCSVVYGEGRTHDARVEPPCVATLLVGPGYFAALGIPVRGRVPTWSDLDSQTGAVVVTGALAERLWPGEDPIGKGVRSNGPTPPYYRVVGVVDQIRGTGLEQPPTEAVFYPMKQIPGASLWQPPNASTLVVKGEVADPSTLVSSIRRVVSELDPSVPLANIRTMESVVRASMARVSFIMALLAVAAAMAVILSAVGLYAVISYVVAQRRSEIGVRMALGARVGQVSRLVMVESLQLAGLGVLLGVSASLVLNRMLSTLVFGVGPNDPLTLAGVSALLIGIALLASLVPARRASHVDPIEVLREG